MSFVDSLGMFNSTIPSQEESYQALIQAQPQPTPVDPGSYQWEWQRQYDALRTSANQALGGYVTPYEGTGWGGNPLVMNNLEKMFMAAAESKLDPSRLFTSETTQLRTIGADQLKILRLFEAKLRESLTEKGKYGLNEMDIEGIQALTAGKGVLISAVKEQVAIKAKKAELMIKQQAAAQTSALGGTGGGRGNDGLNPSSPYSSGRAFMDDIFGMTIPDPATTSIPATIGTEMSVDSAADLISGIAVTNEIANEAVGHRLAVIIDGNDYDSARYAMVDSAGNEVDANGVILPDSSGIKIEEDGEHATGEGFVKYDVIRK